MPGEHPVGDEVMPQSGPTDSLKQPNILMLFSDQHNAFMSGFMGDDKVQTPNLDRLARQGVVLERAYCNSPLCSPARQSFMAGLHCHQIDMWNNTSAMPPDTVTWAHMLSLAGYETSMLGKMHFNGYQKMYGFDRRPVLEGNNRGESFYSWGLRTSHLWTDPLPYKSSGGEGMKPQLKKAGPDTPEREPIFRKDLEVLEGALKYLEEKAENKDGQPWTACIGFVLPHPPYKARPDILERYRGRGDLPFNREGGGRDECDRWLQEFFGRPDELSDDEIKNAREVYWSLITEFDEYAGRILDKLEALGLAEDTVVFYFSDHGDMAGEHGMWGKVTLLEGSSRVPMIASWKGHWPEGRRVAETPVSLADLYPTFLDIAGIEMPEPLYLSGHSLLSLIEGKGDAFEGGTVFCEFEGEGWNHPRAFVVEGWHKYVYNHTADERLYDLKADPKEMEDLSDRPEFAKVKERMKRRLLDEWGRPNRPVPAAAPCAEDGFAGREQRQITSLLSGVADAIEHRVHLAQQRRRIARCKNVCRDIGW